MKTVADATRDKKIKTVVSMNPIMVDGTGMCGSCRLTVSGKLKYACIDGPEFDGHEVDFNEAVMRNSIYKEQEHRCNIRGKW
jgi:oxidoreductase FAD/NAD(P)-binding domain protein